FICVSVRSPALWSCGCSSLGAWLARHVLYLAVLFLFVVVLVGCVAGRPCPGVRSWWSVRGSPGAGCIFVGPGVGLTRVFGGWGWVAVLSVVSLVVLNLAFVAKVLRNP